jgi:hypothetical protein
LQQHNVPFIELDVSKNFANLRQMRRLTASRQVPVCAREDRVVLGYDPMALKKLFYGEERLSE